MRRILLVCGLVFTFFLSPVRAYHEIADLSRLVPGLVILTSFAYDYGDMLAKVTYQGKDYKPHEATEKILPLLDWRSRPDKLELGVAWVKVFALHRTEVIEKGDKNLPGDDQVPRAEILEDGTFRYTAWVRVMSGREPGLYVFKKQIDVSPDAVMTVTNLEIPDTRPVFNSR